MKPVNLRSTKESIKLMKFNIKDKTGTIPVSVWGAATDQTAAISVGDCVEIKNGTVGDFEHKPTINLNPSPATIISVSYLDFYEYKILSTSVANLKPQKQYQHPPSCTRYIIVYTSRPKLSKSNQ
jgi:OB-fold nucleic acid binding domain.